MVRDMLHFDPDGMAVAGSTLCGHRWAITWRGEALADDRLLLSVIAASKDAMPRQAGAMPGKVRPSQATFQPERMSGFCAAG
jgi:hypothetical protein